MTETKWYDRRSDLYWVKPQEIVVLDGWNPRLRENFALDDLLPSIRENGILVPLRVRRNRDGQIELRDGERRYRAVMELIAQGTPILTVPCILEKSNNDAELLLSAMIANTGKPFTALEESEGYRRFIAWGWSTDQLAQRLGKSASTVRASLALLDAAPEVMTALQNGTVSRSEAVAVVREARRTEADQGTVMAERQTAKREKKTREKAPERVEVMPETLEQQVARLCTAHGAAEVVNAAIEYLQSIDPVTAYLQALLDAQDVAAQEDHV